MIELNLSGKRQTPVILQGETSEYGIACVAMILGHFGNHTPLNEFRKDFKVSSRGSGLQHVLNVMKAKNLEARPLKADLGALETLTLPLIIHWNLNHFVVLTEIRKSGYVIHDPTRGRRFLSKEDFSSSYTGIAVESSPSSDFQKKGKRDTLPIRSLLGHSLGGLLTNAAKIIGVTLIIQLIILINPLFFQIAIDKVVVNSDFDLMLKLGGVFICLTIIFFAGFILRGYLQLYLTSQLSFQISSNLFKKMLKLPSDYFQSRDEGSIMTRFESLDPVRRILVDGTVTVFIDGILALSTLALMFYYSIALAVISVLFLFMYFVLRFLTYGILRQREETVIRERGNNYTATNESIRIIDSIKLLGAENERSLVWQQIMSRMVNAQAGIMRITTWIDSANTTLSSVEKMLIIFVAVLLVISGDFTVGMLIAFLAYQQSFSSKASGLVDVYLDYKLLTLHMDRIADIALEEDEYLGDASSSEVVNEDSISIAMKDISFRYAKNLPFVLNKASFHASPGETVAIVGPSGSGKSTLIKVLTGLLKPESGTVLVNNVNINHVGLKHYRECLGVVMQDDDVITGSIADNISFNDPDASPLRICEAAKLAALDEDVQAMPMKYFTLLGNAAKGLSGGQRQRLMLARALYRKPKLLIVDEGTSNLDVDTEKKVNETVRDLKVTRIIIAHRPQTIAMADRVYKFEDGVLTECDTRSYISKLT